MDVQYMDVCHLVCLKIPLYEFSFIFILFQSQLQSPKLQAVSSWSMRTSPVIGLHTVQRIALTWCGLTRKSPCSPYPWNDFILQLSKCVTYIYNLHVHTKLQSFTVKRALVWFKTALRQTHKLFFQLNCDTLDVGECSGINRNLVRQHSLSRRKHVICSGSPMKECL